MATIAVDTSVVVAALLTWHAEHKRSLNALQRAVAAGDDLVLPGHVLIESYSVLTRLPAQHRIAPAVAQELLRRSFHGKARTVSLTGPEVWTLLSRCAKSEVSGGLTYDARILAAARKARVDVLLTLDVRDYERLDPGHIRVVAP